MKITEVINLCIQIVRIRKNILDYCRTGFLLLNGCRVEANTPLKASPQPGYCGGVAAQRRNSR